MTGREVEFVPATREMVLAFYGVPPVYTLRGHAAILDGQVVGIGGISYQAGCLVLFTDAGPELRARRRDMVLAFRFLEEMIKPIEGPLQAIVQPGEPASERLLGRLGFQAADVAGVMRRGIP
jgi:hypothetical protein